MRTFDPLKHEQKRQAILDAAIKRFTESGFQGTSISGICAEAKISAGHLYHYFENKEAILGAIAEIALEQAADHFSRMITGAEPMTALKSYLERIRGFGTDGSHRLVLDLFSEANRNDALAAVLQRHSQGMKNLLAEVLRQGQALGQVDPSLDADTAASILIGVFDGAKIMPVRDPELDRRRSIEMLQVLIERFIAA